MTEGKKIHASSTIAGALVRGNVRKLLTRANFVDPAFTWIEEKYWLESKFIYRGPEKIVKGVDLQISAWANEA